MNNNITDNFETDCKRTDHTLTKEFGHDEPNTGDFGGRTPEVKKFNQKQTIDYKPHQQKYDKWKKKATKIREKIKKS